MKIFKRQQEIKERVALVAHQMSLDYEKKHPVIVGVLRGSFIFTADLVRQLHIPLEVDFIQASGGQITGNIGQSVAGRHVVIVEDIIDTGATQKEIYKYFCTLSPQSITTCALLKRKNATCEYFCFTAPCGFVVGYGMDHAGKFREWPDLYEINPY